MKQMSFFDKPVEMETRCPECRWIQDDSRCGLQLEKQAPCIRYLDKVVSDKEATHQSFLGELRDSRPSVFRVAKAIHESGVEYKVPPPKEAKTYDEGKSGKFSDEGDIHVFIDGVQYRVEVKKLGYDWVGPDCFPFKIRREFFMCSMNSWRTATLSNKRPMVFVYLNKDWSHFALVLPVQLAGKWDGIFERSRKVNDTRYPGEKPQHTVVLRPEWAHFYPIEELSWNLMFSLYQGSSS